MFGAWLPPLHPRSNPHPLHPQLGGASSLLLLRSGISHQSCLQTPSTEMISKMGAGAVNIIMLPTLLIPVTWFPDHKGLVSKIYPNLHPAILGYFGPPGAWDRHLRLWTLVHSLLSTPDSPHQPRQPSSIEGKAHPGLVAHCTNHATSRAVSKSCLSTFVDTFQLISFDFIFLMD